jgi:formate dehydrogenase subunit gamma
MRASRCGALIGALSPPTSSTAGVGRNALNERSEATEPWLEEVRVICAAHGNRPEALIEILHAVQDRLRFVPGEAVPVIADALNVSRADIHGVVSFYHDFRHAPPGRHVLRLCRAEACQSMGARRLAAHAERKLGVKFGETTKDDAVTLEAVYCLGNCALAPAAMVDGALQGHLDEKKLDALVEGLREGARR